MIDHRLPDEPEAEQIKKKLIKEAKQEAKRGSTQTEAQKKDGMAHKV